MLERISDLRMAFDLPRSPRSLRFTGEVRSLRDSAAAREEEHVPPSGIDTPTRFKTVRGRLPSIAAEDEDEDDHITLCLDRDALDIALLPDARPRSPMGTDPMLAPQRPVPHFRSMDDVIRQRQAAIMAPPPQRVGGPLPLVAWLIAASVAAVVSFYAAPMARMEIEEALHASAR